MPYMVLLQRFILKSFFINNISASFPFTVKITRLYIYSIFYVAILTKTESFQSLLSLHFVLLV